MREMSSPASRSVGVGSIDSKKRPVDPRKKKAGGLFQVAISSRLPHSDTVRGDQFWMLHVMVQICAIEI